MSLFPVHTLDSDFARCHKLIYSFPKTGKSTLAAQMVDQQGRKPLFLMTEEGLGSLRVHFVRVRSWDGFRRLVDDLDAKRDQVAAEYSTIVVDVVGDLEQWCAAEMAKKLRVEHVADAEAKGWALLRQEITKVFSTLLTVAPITFIAHSKEKEIKINGDKVKGQAPSLGAACFDFINGKVDAIMWINPATSKNRDPKITMRPTATAIAGCRQKAIAKEYDFSPANPSAAYAQICADYKKAQLELAGDFTATTVDAPAPAQPKE